jgi:hypothetical protein
MIVFVNGCSHSVGSCVTHLDNWPRLLMNSLSTKHIFHTSVPIDFELKNENVLFNLARNGAGNDYIFHNTLEQITQLIDLGLKPDLVIIQWSGPNRRYTLRTDGEVIFVNLHDNLDFHIKLEPMGTENTIHYMFLMQEFLKINKIRYYFFNYMGLDDTMIESNLFKKIDLKKIIDFGLGENMLKIGVMSLIKQNGYSCNGDIDLHPNIIGNVYIRDEVIKKMSQPTNPKHLSLI